MLNRKSTLVSLLLVLAGSATFAAWWFHSDQKRRDIVYPPNRETRLDAVGSTKRMSETLQRVFSEDFGKFEAKRAPKPGDWLAEHDESGQTYEQYLGYDPNRPSSKRGTIYLQPIGKFEGADLEGGRAPSVEKLREYAAIFFQMPVKVLPTQSLEGTTLKNRINGFTDKRQYLTGPLLSMLTRKLPKDGYCCLGITMEDLYPEESWNFVFGQAYLKKRVGVYSFARNHPSFFGEKEGPNQKAETFGQAAHTLVHETLHMFGMHHCIFYECVVNGSNSLEESKAQPLHLCPVCLRKLTWSTKLDPVKRYEQLERFYRRVELEDQAKWVAERLVRIKK